MTLYRCDRCGKEFASRYTFLTISRLVHVIRSELNKKEKERLIKSTAMDAMI